MDDFMIGERVRIKEVRGSPRPPAQWLGKRGKILAQVAQALMPEAPTDRRQKPGLLKAGREYFVEIDGFSGTHSVPETWLART